MSNNERHLSDNERYSAAASAVTVAISFNKRELLSTQQSEESSHTV